MSELCSSNEEEDGRCLVGVAHRPNDPSVQRPEQEGLILLEHQRHKFEGCRPGWMYARTGEEGDGPEGGVWGGARAIGSKVGLVWRGGGLGERGASCVFLSDLRACFSSANTNHLHPSALPPPFPSFSRLLILFRISVPLSVLGILSRTTLADGSLW